METVMVGGATSRPEKNSSTELVVLRQRLGAAAAQLDDRRRLGGDDRLLQRLMDDFMAPVVISSMAERRILYLNGYASRYLGVRVEEAVGLNVLDFWMVSDERARFLTEISRQEQVKDFEASFQSRDGRILHALLSAHTVAFAGEAAMLTLFADITERKKTEDLLKQNEEQYRLLADHRERSGLADGHES